MQIKNFLSLFEYTNWLLKKYNELKQAQENNIYRVVEIKKRPSGQHTMVVQIIGKSSVIECSPQEIVMNDRLLEGFSKKDVRAITYLACEQVKKPKYKIVMQEFYESGGIVFKLQEKKSEDFVVKTANQIVMDKEILNNLSIEDVNSISYIAGYESSQNDMRF